MGSSFSSSTFWQQLTREASLRRPLSQAHSRGKQAHGPNWGGFCRALTCYHPVCCRPLRDLRSNPSPCSSRKVPHLTLCGAIWETGWSCLQLRTAGRISREQWKVRAAQQPTRLGSGSTPATPHFEALPRLAVLELERMALTQAHSALMETKVRRRRDPLSEHTVMGPHDPVGTLCWAASPSSPP